MNKAYKVLWLGQTFANLADLLYIVGILTIIYAKTGSAASMALLPFTVTASSFVSSLFAPIVMDRYSLKHLLLYSQLGKTILLLLLVLSIAHFNLVSLLFMIMLISFLDGVATPARNSMLPLLLSKEQLVKGNSLLAIADETIQLGGWAISGILVVWIGSIHVLWITFLMFALSTLMMGQLPNIRHMDTRTEKPQPWRSIQEGWIRLGRTKPLRVITISLVLDAVASVVWIAAIVYVYVEQVLHEQKQWWGYINTAFILGLLIGGFLMLRSSNRFDQFLKHYLIWGTFIISLATLAFGMIAAPLTALVLSFVIGVAEQVKGISIQTLIQKTVAVSLLPKINSAVHAITSLSYGVSTLIMGLLVDWLGVRSVFILSALLLFGSFLILRGRSQLLTNELNNS